MTNDISAADLNRMLQANSSIKVIDVRTPGEFALGHIPGAVNVPLDTITDRIEGVTAEDRLVLVCQAGGRSSNACQRVSAAHPSALNLVGGTAGWRESGFRVEAGPKAPRSLERQTHLVAGLLLTASLWLHFAVHANWIFLAFLPTFGLLLDALTGVCPARILLSRLPWNSAAV